MDLLLAACLALAMDIFDCNDAACDTALFYSQDMGKQQLRIRQPYNKSNTRGL